MGVNEKCWARGLARKEEDLGLNMHGNSGRVGGHPGSMSTISFSFTLLNKSLYLLLKKNKKNKTVSRISEQVESRNKLTLYS